MKCTGTNRQGNPCGLDAIRGGRVCWRHGGNAKQVRAKAAMRHDLSRWGLDGIAETVDPGETLLRLLTQSYHRAQTYADELARLIAEHGIHEALVGETLIVDPNSGSVHKVGEYVRGLAQMERDERKFCGHLSAQAIAAGLAERSVRLAERQGSLIEQVLTAAFDEMNLTDEQRAAAPAAIRTALAVAS